MDDVTSTRIVQPPTGIEAPFAKVKLFESEATDTLDVVQVPRMFGTVATRTSVGSVSTRFAVSAKAKFAFGFPRLTVSVDVPPGTM